MASALILAAAYCVFVITLTFSLIASGKRRA